MTPEPQRLPFSLWTENPTRRLARDPQTAQSSFAKLGCLCSTHYHLYQLSENHFAFLSICVSFIRFLVKAIEPLLPSIVTPSQSNHPNRVKRSHLSHWPCSPFPPSLCGPMAMAFIKNTLIQLFSILSPALYAKSALTLCFSP